MSTEELPPIQVDLVSDFNVFINLSRKVEQKVSWVGESHDTTNYTAVVFRVGMICADDDKEQVKNIRAFYDDHFVVSDGIKDEFEKHILDLSTKYRVVLSLVSGVDGVKVNWVPEGKINPIK